MCSTRFLNGDIGAYCVLSCILHTPFKVSEGFMGLRIHLKVICHPCISPWVLNIIFTMSAEKLILQSTEGG